MHSIARLPPEVVREIYGYIYAHGMRLHKLNDFPWHLGQISASWRSIFHSMTSNFWNRLDIDLSIMDKDRDPELVHHHYDVMLLALRYFLGHTRGRPFSFKFKTRQPCMAEEDEWIIRLFELLVAESIRWQEIDIQVGSCLLPVLYKAKHHMPLLSSARLIQVPYNTNLQCIFHYEDDHQFLSVLGQANRLEKLAIYARLGEELYLAKITISFPNLKVLSIIGVDLLPLLQTPSLEELYIQGFDAPPEGPNRSRNEVITFLTRSSCQLKCLGLVKCGADFLTDILQYTPNLLHLDLDNDDRVKSFNQLAFRHCNAPLASHLRSLTVIDRGGFSFREIMELAALLASRTERVEAISGVAPVEKLQKLMIITWSKRGLVQYNKKSAVQTLRQQCAEHGVEFTVQHARDVPASYYDNTSILDW